MQRETLDNPVTQATNTVIGLPNDWHQRSIGGQIDYIQNNTNESDVLTIFREAFSLEGENNQRLNKSELCQLLGVFLGSDTNE